MLSAIAEFEREIIRERVVSGIRAAQAKGIHCGRKAIPTEVYDRARPLVAQGVILKVIATELNVSIGKAHYIKMAILREQAALPHAIPQS